MIVFKGGKLDGRKVDYQYQPHFVVNLVDEVLPDMGHELYLYAGMFGNGDVEFRFHCRIDGPYGLLLRADDPNFIGEINEVEE